MFWIVDAHLLVVFQTLQLDHLTTPIPATNQHQCLQQIAEVSHRFGQLILTGQCFVHWAAWINQCAILQCSLCSNPAGNATGAEKMLARLQHERILQHILAYGTNEIVVQIVGSLEAFHVDAHLGCRRRRPSTNFRFNRVRASSSSSSPEK